VEAYARCGNATQAARLAGYQGEDNVLSTLGAKLVRKYAAEVELLEKKINDRIEASHISNTEIIGLLAQVATSSIDDVTDSGGVIDLKKIKKRRLGHLIKSVTPTKYGPRVQMESRTAALGLLAKIRGLEQAPSDGARESRDRAIARAADGLALALGISVEAAMDRIKQADAGRSGAVLALPAGADSDSIS
jgi:hypothetical protein